MGGGTSLSIAGANFGPYSTVYVGGQLCTNIVETDMTSITASTPAGVALGAVDVTVKNKDGQRAHSKKAFTYTNQASTVTVTQITPSSGGAGAAVTITGSGFQANATVKFATFTAAQTTVVVVNDTEITCNTPGGPQGVADVVVTNPDGGTGTLAGGFTYPGTAPTSTTTTTPTSPSTINTGKTISTLAGTGVPGFSGDGTTATSAALNLPQGVAFNSPDTSIYIADGANQRIRRVDANGTITTVAGTGTAGTGGDNGPPLSAQLNGPQGLAADGAGNIYIADTGNHAIRLLTGTTTLSTVAGTLGTQGSTGDAGAATSALLDGPEDVAFQAGPTLFIADTGNNRVRKVSAGTINAFAGTGTVGFAGDNATATAASLTGPAGVVVDGSGNVFISDTGNARVRKVDTTNTITTFAGGGSAGLGDGGTATSAQLTTPVGLAIDASGSIVIVDAGAQRVRLVASGNLTITTLAGTGVQGSTGDGGDPTAAELSGPRGVATSAAGAYFIADTGNAKVRKVE
jgi:sugar lactone lactonase YvrE